MQICDIWLKYRCHVLVIVGGSSRWLGGAPRVIQGFFWKDFGWCFVQFFDICLVDLGSIQESSGTLTIFWKIGDTHDVIRGGASGGFKNHHRRDAQQLLKTASTVERFDTTLPRARHFSTTPRRVPSFHVQTSSDCAGWDEFMKPVPTGSSVFLQRHSQGIL